ncbi:uncharacterized protein E0L32_011330 [Thyridium curvatum]|uniref:Ribosome quality control complex subunit 2 n=1 Tax=Thyridium curvatum TaxID=1093900 RepID=A0A507BHM2_9PEZI|nr:uncharacterized protein E0L32_011330 [Thyridium curvatum]TPX19013.1 hypothetical protein E0L32_011330 [Thyridium curvatum]
MKQRFSSLDVKAISHELQESLVNLRLANIYDLSSKILLFKFAQPENKKQLVIDCGFRCHLTDFARTTAAAPSPFVARLRKFLKTRRVTGVSQIGTDRIIEFQFSNGAYRLYLEFFVSGNVILTDAELNIITLLRNVPEGEGQEPQRVGLKYSLENRQNYNGVPALTKERLRNALGTMAEKAARAAATGKKASRKAADELRRGLATTMTELPPMLVDHAFQATGFDSTSKPAAVLENDELFEGLFKALEEARRIVDEVTNSPTCKGYIIAKKRPRADGDAVNAEKPEGLLYEDFHPFQPAQFSNDPTYKILDFETFNKTVDEFFSSIEGQKLESRLQEREETAKRRIEATRQDHAKRIEGLQEAQSINLRKAAAIEANVERVQEAMDAVAGLVQQGMDWVDINKLIEREQKRNNPVAEIIKLPLKLQDNMITLRLSGEEEENDEEFDNFDYDTDSSVSEDDDDLDTKEGKEKAADSLLEVDINLGLSPWSNAREYYEEKRTAAVKQQKTVEQSSIALKNAEQKINADLKKGLKQEKAVLQPIRKQFWFEKFLWFISSDGYLVLGGRDAQQNEMIYRRYLRKGDVYVHADLHGAPSVIIKNNPQTPDAPIPPSTLSQAGNLAVCASNAWDSKAGMGAYWVTADQVSKSAPAGEFLPTGSFMIRGKKNFLAPAQLLLGFGIMFKISEESKAKHVKHRLHTLPEVGSLSRSETAETARSNAETLHEDDRDNLSDSDSDDEGDEASAPRANPLQPSQERQSDSDEEQTNKPQAPTEELAKLDVEDEQEKPEAAEEAPVGDEDMDSAAQDDAPDEDAKKQPQPPSRPNPPTQQKQAAPKRGQRGKAKKIAAKYKDQDDEDRAAVEALIGAAAGRQKAEAEAKLKAEKEAQLAAIKERRRQQHQRQQQTTKEHEELRRLMLDEGVEVLDEAEQANLTALDALVGTPLAGDEILEAVPVCGPWTAMAKVKYKAKMQPGAVKKNKALKEVLEGWKAAAGKKGVLDEQSRDTEKMWPREVELIKAVKQEEVANCVPVAKLRVMMAGGAGGKGGGGGGGGGKSGAKGGKGGKKK